MPKKHILVCVQGRPTGHPRGSCQDKGCAAVWQAFTDEFQQRNLWSSGLQLTNTGCLGPCHLGPSVLVYPEGVMYGKVGKDDVKTIIEQHLLGGTPVASLVVPPEVW
jgi:(2Fe-2S) ferredoxin